MANITLTSNPADIELPDQNMHAILLDGKHATMLTGQKIMKVTCLTGSCKVDSLDGVDEKSSLIDSDDPTPYIVISSSGTNRILYVKAEEGSTKIRIEIA